MEKKGEKMTENKIRKFREKLEPSVKNLLDNGSFWSHVLLKEPIQIKAGDVLLIKDLQFIFLQALKNTENRNTFIPLINNKVDFNILETVSSANFTSSISRVIKGKRASAYGWSLA